MGDSQVYKWLGDSINFPGGPRESCTVRGYEFPVGEPVHVDDPSVCKKLSQMGSFQECGPLPPVQLKDEPSDEPAPVVKKKRLTRKKKTS
jgi:hypothetical protein